MNHSDKNLVDTVEAINRLIENRIYEVNVKRVRKVLNIPSTDHSKINFIWRSLKRLLTLGILAPNGTLTPKNYIIPQRAPIQIESVLSCLKDKQTL